MERLTRRDWNKYGFYDKETPILGARHEYELYQKLGRYEDAEEQGLLLWLPCVAGTTVYEVRNNTDACDKCNSFEKAYHYCDDYCTNDNVCNEYGNFISNPQFADKPLCQKHFLEITQYRMYDITSIFNQRKFFGERIFLTREEAEAKLKEMENSHE